ncbi:MAG: hypothetical protein V1761_01525 [bacterium]
MEKGKLDIPFSLAGEDGTLNIVYGEISKPDSVGFEVVKEAGFVPDEATGFPYLRAWIGEFPTKGFRTLSAFIQTTQSKFYQIVDDMMPALNEKAVDVSPFFREKHLPFYAFGYPAAMFSARHSDIRGFQKLNREINTFLVSFPNTGNGFRVECLAAFSWGFVEWLDRGKHQIKIAAVKEINTEHWNNALELLQRTFPKYDFARAGAPEQE